MENMCLAWLRLLRLVTQKPTKNRIWTARLLCALLHHQLPRLTLILILRRECYRFLIKNVNTFHTAIVCYSDILYQRQQIRFFFSARKVWPSGPVSSLARTNHNLKYSYCCCSNMPHSNAATATTTSSSSRFCCWLWLWAGVMTCALLDQDMRRYRVRGDCLLRDREYIYVCKNIYLFTY